MKCDQCGQEATVHDFKLVSGQCISQVHLCEECANKLGLVASPFKSLGDLIQESVKTKAGSARPTRAGVCPECGVTWRDFRDKGLMGCPACYDAFDEQIGPLIERAHERGTHHVGKCPTSRRDEADRDYRIQHLREQLARAISSEQYERAASLRDELTKLGVSIHGGERVEGEASA
ncbi:MAG: UvrB/UvrC motif-containing protein [Phycisphaerales bacterium]